VFFDRDIKGGDLPPGTLCLTYDDGPGSETPELGRYLADEGIRATFFVVGRHAEERADVLRQLAAWGHRLGNHTDTHPGLVAVAESGGDVVGEIARTDAIIRPYLQDEPVFLRPPYGNWRQKRPGSDEDMSTSVVADVLNRSGRFPDYVGPVNWDISAADYDFWERGASAEACTAAYLDKIDRTGRGIVLMHDWSEDPAVRPRNRAFETTRLLVPALKDRGYRFVDLTDLPQVRSAMAAGHSSLVPAPAGVVGASAGGR
jgi:peptidoglycan/xylan/chitin deacetylase (PgdA/CDA1 family)